MKTDNKYRILVWVIVILIATNLSTIGSFFYHREHEMKGSEIEKEDQTSIPGDQRTRFFRDELNLNEDQIDQFREINRAFNHSARIIETNLSQLRQELIQELGSQQSDTTKLNALALQVGEDHRKLKLVTIDFYRDMKNLCNSDQQEKLNHIFQDMLNSNNQVNLPQQGKGRGRWQNK